MFMFMKSWEPAVLTQRPERINWGEKTEIASVVCYFVIVGNICQLVGLKRQF